jgi:putative Mg2+ transporter-C (MgtC) family protein
VDLIVNEFATGISDITELVQSMLRLFVAFLCGAAIGWQRERVGKSAGLRTHILVAVGTALAVTASVEADLGGDGLSRVIQGVLTGIGFLGAGAILKREWERDISGLTTAAGVWTTATIGITAGLGRFSTALLATLFTWIVLSLLHRFDTPGERRDDHVEGEGEREG